MVVAFILATLCTEALEPQNQAEREFLAMKDAIYLRREPWSEIKGRAALFVERYPRSLDYADIARSFVATIKVMEREDRARKAKPATDPMLELVYQLRDDCRPRSEDDTLPAAPNAVPDSEAEEKLRNAGWKAVPAIIRNLTNRSLTRQGGGSEDAMPNFPTMYIYRVGDICASLIYEITAHDFGGWAYHGPNPYHEAKWLKSMSRVRANAQTWWKVNGPKGHFAVLCESIGKSEGVQPAARALVRNFPKEAPRVILSAFSKARAHNRSELLKVMADTRDRAVLAIARKAMFEDNDLHVRMKAAEVGDKTDPQAATEGLLAAWREFGPLISDTNLDPSHILGLLLNRRCSVVFRLLPADLQRRHPAVRQTLLLGMSEPYDSKALIAVSLEFRKAAEPVLIRLLADKSPFEPRNLDFEYWIDAKQSLKRARMCDLAGLRLSQLFPTKYEFRVHTSWDARDKMHDRFRHTFEAGD